MAIQIAPLSIYGENGNSWNNSQGVLMGFAPQSILVRTLAEPVSLAGVTCNSVVQLLPYGPSPNQPQYYSPLTVTQIVAVTNA